MSSNLQLVADVTASFEHAAKASCGNITITYGFDNSSVSEKESLTPTEKHQALTAKTSGTFVFDEENDIIVKYEVTKSGVKFTKREMAVSNVVQIEHDEPITEFFLSKIMCLRKPINMDDALRLQREIVEKMGRVTFGEIDVCWMRGSKNIEMWTENPTNLSFTTGYVIDNECIEKLGIGNCGVELILALQHKISVFSRVYW